MGLVVTGIHEVALLFVGMLNVILSLFIFARNAKSPTNLAFAAMSLGLGGWTIGIAGFLLTSNPTLAMVWAKVYYFFPQVVAASIIIFAHAFGRNKKISSPLLLFTILGFLAIVTPLIIFPSFVTQDLVYHSWGKEIILNKAHYLLYSVYLLLCLIFAEIIMLVKAHKFTGVFKAQAVLFFAGFLITGIFGVLFNLFYPWFGNYRMIWLGPLFTSVFVIAISYSIIKHKMFDIRWFVARSLGYALSIFSLGALYGLLAFNAINAFAFRSSEVTLTQQIFYTLLAVAIAFTFQPLKKFFDRITNRIFYRDAYEPQVLLDDLNKILVGNIELDNILTRSAIVISETMKAEFCLFGIKEMNTSPRRIVGTTQKAFSEEDIKIVRSLTPKMKTK